MNKSGQNRFYELYRMHLQTLKFQGMSDKTIDAYSRAVRRIAGWFDCLESWSSCAYNDLPCMGSRAETAKGFTHIGFGKIVHRVKHRFKIAAFEQLIEVG